MAERDGQTILYNMKEYNALDFFDSGIITSCKKHTKNLGQIPYEQGEEDGMIYLLKNFPENKFLEKIRVDILKNAKKRQKKLNSEVGKSGCEICLREKITKVKEFIGKLSNIQKYKIPTLKERLVAFEKLKISFPQSDQK